MSSIQKSSANQYFDDEFCHEQFSGLPYIPSSVGTKCSAANAPPAADVAPYVASMSPNTGTAAALKYKWSRITMKQNGAFQIAPPATAGMVDTTQAASSPVCWDAFAYQERVAGAMGGAADCNAAVANGYNVQPLYLITSLAVTPSGSRRVGQYEVAAFNIAPPASGLALDGPPSAANFNPPNSTNGVVNGNDGSWPTKPGSHYAAAPAVPGCTPQAAPAGTHPAIGVDNAAAVTTIDSTIAKPNNYQGTNWVNNTTPSVATVPLLATANWSNPTTLNNLASEMANVADVTCPGNALCAGPTYGTAAAPQITYANGNFTLGSGNNGAGILVVTGTLTISGKMEWDGLILVIGQGSVTISGGGDGTIFGELFVANTAGAVGGVLGTPTFNWNGGGSAGIFYNSCWAAIGNNLHLSGGRLLPRRNVLTLRRHSNTLSDLDLIGRGLLFLNAPTWRIRMSSESGFGRCSRNQNKRFPPPGGADLTIARRFERRGNEKRRMRPGGALKILTHTRNAGKTNLPSPHASPAEFHPGCQPASSPPTSSTVRYVRGVRP